jgi:hypothetical protein
VCECKYDIDENRLLRWRKRFGSKTAPRSSPFGYNRASAEHRPFGKDGAALTQLHLQHICCVGPDLFSADARVAAMLIIIQTALHRSGLLLNYPYSNISRHHCCSSLTTGGTGTTC